MITKYGKSLHDIFQIKQTFFENNSTLLAENLYLAKIAKEQPKRKRCKNCNEKVNEKVFFKKQGINYYLCSECNHLYGEFEDTLDFANAIYVDEVTNYSKNYSSADKEKWEERVKKVYNPKAEFLFDCLLEERQNKDISLIDIGAGSGYFLKALMNHGFKNIKGYEVSEVQTQFANNMLQDTYVEKIEINQLAEIVSATKSEVISMIGVLEHLINPREVLEAISKNKNIKYYYISLPLFSFSVFFELNNENYFNRQLANGHTHLYTKKSIEYFCKDFNFEIIGQWFFGSDAMDFFRFNFLKMKEQGASEEAIKLFSDKFSSIIDEIQLSFDRAEFASEVHLLLKVN